MAGIPTCCDEVIGGEVYITARFSGQGQQGAPPVPPGQGTGQPPGGGNFVTYEGMGEIRIQPSRVSRTAGASSGGAVWITEAARPVRAIMSYVNRCTNDPMRLFMERCNIDVTIVEKSRGVWHYMTGATIVGDIEKNLTSGEITGMEIVASNYRVRQARQAEQTAGQLIPVAA